LGDLEVNAGSVTSGEGVMFNNDTQTAVFTIGTLAPFDAVIDNFNSLDSIVIQGSSIGSSEYTAGSLGANGTLALFSGPTGTGTEFGTLAVSAGISASDLAFLEMVNDGTIGAVPCFAAGTRLATANGWVAVEDVRAGTVLRTVLGGSGQVVWVGRRHVLCARHPKPRAVWPVRVAAGAFGPGLPERTLWLSPDHALYVDGVLIPVRYLVNGGSVAQVAVAEVSYYHVELRHHDVLLAEGLPAESYLETGGRAAFANGGAPVMLHPEFGLRRWEAEGCAPLVVTGPVVEAVRRRVSLQPSAGSRRSYG
ncbi:MAG: Hint domain-containing protein, partial [Streptosporangiaceae bacterium]